MAPPIFAVRNLTSADITIKTVEAFEDPDSKQSRASAFSFAPTTTTLPAPTSNAIEQHSKSFNQKNTEITLSPCDSYSLDAQNEPGHEHGSSAQLSTIMYRLTIENDKSERFRIDINPTYTQKSSHLLTPLTPNPSTSLTALYHPTTPKAQVTIHANHLHDPATWMSKLPSELPLSALSIPGTHNSHTYYRALPSVRCQVVGVKAQLENGIRFLDIRVQPVHASDPDRNKDLYLVHGAFPVSLTGPKYLTPILSTCYEFLSQHPSETILISLKREGVGSSTDAHVSQILSKHYIGPNREKWHIEPTMPYLGDVRGKLVLIRRFDLPSSSSDDTTHATATTPLPLGLDATSWPHNSTHALHGPFCVQDYCEIMQPTQIPDKLTHSTSHLARSAAATAFIPGVTTDAANPVPPGPLYLNFLSGSNFWNVGCWPEKIAKVVNRGVEEWVCGEMGLGEGGDEGGVRRRLREGDGGAGVVVMDNVGDGGDWDLVRLIVGLNMGVVGKM
ncbi:PLC-like phosphodiesterase [Aaosphaeria arxii CBS 175.79]|uniref:PLC-like phosphodiesterase n=1 Tax=Aaosphaeria arxii CBS 175.79 TaxID=1450172 RepID=A0A6A5Y225_9PLEO|nr:PLC-like phosphodiesterase [Aaosphaeria arxii CBS 175.79]KAF2018961.1 PLC-like phosphodiesterase [Aaosphaeria arxii CBS 175.79]